MKNHHKLNSLLLLLLFLALGGCGNNEVDAEPAEAIEVADTAGSAEAVENIQTEGAFTVDQDTYKMLAETNIVLQREKTELTLEYGYYENIYLNQSAQNFEKKDVMTGILNGNQNNPETEYTPAKYPKLNSDSQTDISIPEIDDSELENRIAELQAENEELTAQISYLTEQIAVYKTLCGYE